jgi:hypothetical protein
VVGNWFVNQHWKQMAIASQNINSAFHFNILQDFILTFNEKADELVEVLKRDCDKPYTEISPLMTHFSLKIIGGE